MKLLLDTHIFLWYISGDNRLPQPVRDLVRSLENDVHLSVVSLWEVIIKYEIGKLSLPEPPEKYLPRQRKRHLMTSLPVNEASVVRLAKLPSLHRDPFDRLLVCQAIEHHLTIVTADKILQGYPVPILKS